LRANGDGAAPTAAFLPGIRCTAKSRFSTSADGTAARSTQSLAKIANQRAEGEEFVSDVVPKLDTFFALYDCGRVTAEQIDDFVEAWHESGDDEQRSLAEFLGVTEEEYGILIITDRALPAILAARRANRPLREFVAPLFESLQSAANPDDKPVLHAMGYWLKHHPPE
jgi:hypothetical protein